MKKLIAIVLATAAGVAAWLVTSASPAVNVTFELLSRGTFDPFKAFGKPGDLVDFDVRAKHPLDVVVRAHNYAPGGSTGWHTHPGPVFITVTEGTLTFYEYGDPTCTGKIVTAGQGYFDSGHGHIAINHDLTTPAQDVSVIIAPVGLPFRGELDAPGPHCTF